jgi:glycosyltransferase involved in cell wall biosynthesis
MRGGSPAGAMVEIVMVVRERYAPTPASVRAVLDTTAPEVRITLVRGGMPRSIRRSLDALDDERLRVIGPARHLRPNAARRLGLAAATARFVVFVDNDLVPAAGWLERLVHTAVATDAWVVRPLVLQHGSGRTTIHDAGGDCHVEARGAHRVLVENHRYVGLEPSAAPPLVREQVPMFEFHAVLFDRERLVAIGGPDERMRTQGEHLDLCLRIAAAGGTIWLEPDAVVVYQLPERLGLRDLAFFLGRWSRSWNDASRRAFEETHGVDDPDDVSFTWRYADLHRAYAWLPLVRPFARALRAGSGRWAAGRLDALVGRHLGEAALRVAPGWRGDGALAG